MKSTLWTTLLLILFVSVVPAQSYDNYQKKYVLRSVTNGQIEAERTHRMVLCDYQPTGLYVRKGEKISFSVSELNRDYDLSSMIGFKPMWGNRNKTQEDQLRNGINVVTAIQDGILSFIFVKRTGYDIAPTTVKISITGGKAFPLYKLNRSNIVNWQNDLRSMTNAPFVQLISDKVLITIPYRDYLRDPISDIPASFRTIHQVVDWEDELAGFDDSSTQNMRTNNRIHYAVDLYSTEKEQEDYYMYASNYFIGMKRDNFTDLTAKLDTGWGIWHETGHTQQQNSWTWGSINEISVNIFSLYVQEKFGLPSRLNDIESDETETSFAKARKYIAQPTKNYLDENPDDYNELFSKLTMFYQLRAAYGWQPFKKLHQYFRKEPFVDVDETDQDKANKFVYAMCVVTGNDLTPFFSKWGLRVDPATGQRIKGLKLPYSRIDPAKIFR